MKKVCQELGYFRFGDEVRHDKFGRSAFAVWAKPKCSPTAVNRPDGNQRPKDFEAKFLHDFLQISANRTVTGLVGEIRQVRMDSMSGIGGFLERPLLVDSVSSP